MNDYLRITIIPIWDVKVVPCHNLRVYFGVTLNFHLRCFGGGGGRFTRIRRLRGMENRLPK